MKDDLEFLKVLVGINMALTLLLVANDIYTFSGPIAAVAFIGFILGSLLVWRIYRIIREAL